MEIIFHGTINLKVLTLVDKATICQSVAYLTLYEHVVVLSLSLLLFPCFGGLCRLCKFVLKMKLQDFD